MIDIPCNNNNNIISTFLEKIDFEKDDDETDELFQGLLQYRIQGQLHQAHNEELQQLELKKMTMTNKIMSRRYSNAFSRRLSDRKASSSSSSSLSTNVLPPNDHAEFIKADLIKTLPDIHELHLQRLHRAEQNQQNILKVISTTPTLNFMMWSLIVSLFM
jgi:2-phospho-L-lactate transferase/gluconeogenesis factor (CofD/UPF0052 family)